MAGRIAGNKSLKLDELCSNSVVSYVDIFKSYVKLQENICDIDEEIDTMLYSYELEWYENVTFVEPPETTERRICQCFIAIDTSGSCNTKMVAKFLSQTRDVIWEVAKNNSTNVDIYLILCDVRIEQEIHISSMEDFPEVKDLNISSGRTDFRPVFDRVNQIIKEQYISNQTALFYYTDGYGRFPEQKPEYDTYFLMNKNDAYGFSGSDWIRTIVI